MSGWVKVGAQCVCISDDFGSFKFHPELELPVRHPMLNEVLTIARVYVEDNGVFLSFVEIDELQRASNANGSWIEADITWSAKLFRPLIRLTQADDVAMFKRLALDAGVPV